MEERFDLPVIHDDDIRRICQRLVLPIQNFFEAEGAENRLRVLKTAERIDVAACPGSGKTTLLVAKLAMLAEKWTYRSHGLCVLSHTNVAKREVELRLGHSIAGQRLSGHPHFIGTIHAFVNEFLAIPWLVSRGYPVRMIDDEVCLTRRWYALPRATRFALEKSNKSQEILRVRDTEFGVGDIPWGKGKAMSPDTPTYQAIRAACAKSAEDGFFCHDEMFLWAHDLMDKQPMVIRALRDRFPLVFIDEAQDTHDEQADIVHRMFLAGDRPAMCQRFGDGNQAIFSSINASGPTEPGIIFPDATLRLDLPVSHRFGQVIANLADPLGLVPYNLVGRGPRRPLASGSPEAEHTIFLFEDKVGAQKVLPAYGELLLNTFSVEELRSGLFKAVGQVHANISEDHFPGKVSHYWDAYDPDISRMEPRPQTFVQYLFAGLSQAIKRGEAFLSIDKIAEGILRGAAICSPDVQSSGNRRAHQKILSKLASHPAVQQDYLDFVLRHGIQHAVLTKSDWEQKVRDKVRGIMELIADCDDSGGELEKFLEWKDSAGNESEAKTPSAGRQNIQRFVRDEKEVIIHLGSIHSVKGETHTSTLVLETFWHNHNLTSLRDWLLGDRIGGARAKDREASRLKLHYVAMTRPSHLICLALPKKEFAGGTEKEAEIFRKLRTRGWTIREV